MTTVPALLQPQKGRGVSASKPFLLPFQSVVLRSIQNLAEDSPWSPFGPGGPGGPGGPVRNVSVIKTKMFLYDIQQNMIQVSFGFTCSKPRVCSLEPQQAGHSQGTGEGVSGKSLPEVDIEDPGLPGGPGGPGNPSPMQKGHKQASEKVSLSNVSKGMLELLHLQP